jgi:hypothetical protein
MQMKEKVIEKNNLDMIEKNSFFYIGLGLYRQVLQLLPVYFFLMLASAL